MLQIALVNVSNGRLEPELWSCLGTENLVGSEYSRIFRDGRTDDFFHYDFIVHLRYGMMTLMSTVVI